MSDLLGSLIIGGLSYAGTESTNSANMEAVRATNASNEKIAAQNNALMMELANSAHQREVKDLVKAGLNPVLSVDGAGAPVPALTSARMEAPRKENSLGNAVNSALSAYQATKQAQQIDANIGVADATAKNLDVQNEKLKAEIDETKAKTYKTLYEADLPGVVGGIVRPIKTFFGGRESAASRFERKFDDSHKKVHDLGTTTIKAHRGHSAKDLPYIGSFFK